MFLDFMGWRAITKNRKIDHFEKDDILVSTCSVTDSEQPYETGIAHPAYNGGDMVVVELYSSKEDARKGHKKWVRKMTAKKLPKSLKDVSSATIAQICDSFGGEKWWERPKQ